MRFVFDMVSKINLPLGLLTNPSKREKTRKEKENGNRFYHGFCAYCLTILNLHLSTCSTYMAGAKSPMLSVCFWAFPDSE